MTPDNEPLPSLLPDPQQVPMPQDVRTPGQGKHILSSVGKRYFNLIEFDDNEELLHEIRKHGFGLLIIIATGVFVSVAILAVTIALANSGIANQIGFSSASSVLVFLGFIMVMFIILVTSINAQLYRSNVAYVTNEKIAQILHVSLFNKKISQLSIGDVQDVSVTQNGLIPTLLGYGTLVIETAGEQQNYTFTYIPHPHTASKIIIYAHELNMKKYGN